MNVEPERYDEESKRVLSTLGEVTEATCTSQQDFEAAVSLVNPMVVLVRLGLAITETLLQRAPALRIVATPTTGLDHLDLDACERRQVRVLSLKGQTDFLESITATAEHTWGLLLSLLRKIPAAHASVVNGRWERAPFLGEELAGSTLGVLGVGRLGRMVARYGLAFGMRVLGHDTSARFPEGVAPVPLDQLLTESRVLSIHLPLDASTRGFLNQARLARLPHGSVLVNTARGELIDEVALLKMLESGHLSGAALDVLAGDSRWEHSAPDNHPLVRYALSHDNLLLTPHTGGYGRQSIARTRRFMVDQLERAVFHGATS